MNEYIVKRSRWDVFIFDTQPITHPTRRAWHCVWAKNTVSSRVRRWHSRGRHDGIYAATDGRIKPSTDGWDDQASVRAPTEAASTRRIFHAIAFRFSQLIGARHAAGWFISYAYVELIWWTLPVRTVCLYCPPAFRRLIVRTVRHARVLGPAVACRGGESTLLAT